MPLTMRLATRTDVDAMTALHMSSFSADDHLGALLGPGFVRASYLWHVTDSMAWVIVAELHGQVVGLLGMCDGPFTKRMLRGCSTAFAAALLRRPRLLADRRLWSRLVRTKATPAWVAQFCAEPGVAQMTIGAVDAKTRGHSVFPALIARCEVEGRARGLQAVRAGLYTQNVPCYRAFVKSGWTEVPELGSDDTTYFVRAFHREVVERFPYLADAGVANPET